MDPGSDPAGFLKGRTRETHIARDAEGRWFNEGQPLEHPNLCRSFDRWIERADDGRYCLKNDINWAYITLEGAPFFVRSVRYEGEGGDGLLWLQLSDAREERLDAASLRQGPDGALYCDVRNGTMVARFDRSAAAQLLEVIDEDEQGVYLRLGGQRVRPPTMDDPLTTGGRKGSTQER